MELKIFGFFLEKYWDFLTFYLVSYLLLTESESTFKEFANFSKVVFSAKSCPQNTKKWGCVLYLFGYIIYTDSINNLS